MTEAQLTDDMSSASSEASTQELHSEEYLAARCMFLKDYDLLDIDRGHFWYKLSWHGVHVEFPSPHHHYEANPDERVIRDYLLSLPVSELERTFAELKDSAEAELESGDHHFRFAWDQEVRPHLHCYYQRSAVGRRHDSEAYQQHLQDHTHRYESNRQFPSQRLMQRLSRLREERAKAQRSVDAWERMIVQLEEQIALDQIVHTGRVEESSFA